eukprot:bmy_08589T0
MPRRRPSSCAQQVAPEGLPGGGDRRRRDPLLPRLLPLELRAASGAGASGGSRASEGGAEWWEAPACESSHSDPGVGVRRPRSRLPVLPTVAQRAARNRTGLRSPLLPPMLLAGEPREPAPRAWTVRGPPQGLGQGEPRLFGRPPRRVPPRPVPAGCVRTLWKSSSVSPLLLPPRPGVSVSDLLVGTGLSSML